LDSIIEVVAFACFLLLILLMHLIIIDPTRILLPSTSHPPQHLPPQNYYHHHYHYHHSHDHPRSISSVVHWGCCDYQHFAQLYSRVGFVALERRLPCQVVAPLGRLKTVSWPILAMGGWRQRRNSYAVLRHADTLGNAPLTPSNAPDFPSSSLLSCSLDVA